MRASLTLPVVAALLLGLLLTGTAGTAGCYLGAGLVVCEEDGGCPSGTACELSTGLCRAEDAVGEGEGDAGEGDAGEGEGDAGEGEGDEGEGEGDAGEGEGDAGEGEGEGEGTFCDAIAGAIFCDDFESGTLNKWSAQQGPEAILEVTSAAERSFSLHAASTGEDAAAVVQTPTAPADFWWRAQVLLPSTSEVNGDTPIATFGVRNSVLDHFHLYVGEFDELWIETLFGDDDVGGRTIARDVFACVEVHIELEITIDQAVVQLFIDGDLIDEITDARSFAPEFLTEMSVGIVESGDAAQSFDVRFDDVLITGARVPCP